jgi:hypothetical protein
MGNFSSKLSIHQIKWSTVSRFMRRMVFGLLALAGLLWFAVRTEVSTYQRGIESSKATGLASIARSYVNAPMLSKGATPQLRMAQAAVVRQGVLIARTASIRVSVINFGGARESVDRIVKTHTGYIAAMTISNPKDASQSLSANIAIPTGQCDAALEEFKKLGHVEEERQGREEVSEQSEDLDIRLKNSREAESRLGNILQMRTDKVADILEFEKEMARVREEIEQMEAEQKRLNNRVAFASIDLSFTEEYRAQLGNDPSSATRQIRNALVDGYHAAADGFLSVILLFLSAGPSVILWALILFWPARWAWRRWRSSHANGVPSL